MVNYTVICNDHVIKRGECMFYASMKDIVPIGYVYTWAFVSPELITVNVKPTLKEVPEIEKTPAVVGMQERAREKVDPYRMATG